MEKSMFTQHDIPVLFFKKNRIESMLVKYNQLADIYSKLDWVQFKIYENKIKQLNLLWLEIDEELSKLSKQWKH